MINYRSSLRFVLVQWFLAELWTLKFGQIFSCHHFFPLWFEILTWFLVWVYNDKLQINFEIHSGWMIFGQLAAVGLWNLTKYLIVTTYFSIWFEILTWFLVFGITMMSYRSSFIGIWLLIHASVVDSWSYQDLLRQYCFLE